jgi:carbon-monoxide dehydrogenase large subunit
MNAPFLPTTEGIGRPLRRVEDERFLRGRGEYVADIRPAGTQELAFVRSPLGHARIRAIRKPENVYTAADLDRVDPITAISSLPGFKPSSQPVLASDVVRHVGEAIAVCVAPTRAEAEDLADQVELDL